MAEINRFANKTNVAEIEDIIRDSGDLITALEAVGAMYGIPATQILQDDSQQAIKVVNDTIIAPNRSNAIANTQSIVCAIGSVLDYISQRIDTKLDNYHSDTIERGKFDTAVANGDPNKGTVVSRYETDDGDEIVVYDSGIVDHPHTASSLRKVAELRNAGSIPAYKSDKDGMADVATNKYFTDEEDISVGVDTTTSTPDIGSTDVADSIGESAKILELISDHNNTTHLGYDIFSEMGYDIKPSNGVFVQEAAKTKKTKTINPKDIKHMKFDNKHIRKAVQYFNQARAAQKNVKFTKDLNIKEFVNHPSYNKGVKELEAQFDCHIAFKWVKNNEGYQNAGTLTYNKDYVYDYDISISKSKGFQLHGAGIWVRVDEYGLFSDAPIKQDMFGQALVAVTLHEIFHNIANMIRSKSDAFLANTAITTTLVISARSAKRKREILNKYCDSIKDLGIFDISNPVKKQLFIKSMMLMSSVQDPGDLNQVIDTSTNITSEAEIDKTIEKYAALIKRKKKIIKKSRNWKIPLIGFIAGGISTGIFTGIAAAAPITVLGTLSGIMLPVTTGATFLNLLFYAMIYNYDKTYKKVEEMYQKGHAFEESWCDLFAGMYNYPVVFYIKSATSKNNNYTPNTVGNVEKLNELAALEKELYTILFTTYPTNSERNHAAARIAANALKQKGLDPATKKYLKWVSDNFSSMLETDISKEEVNTTYDPNRANDIDKHIQDIIDQGQVTVTESAI